MSYDFYLIIDAGNGEVAIEDMEWNYTYNLCEYFTDIVGVPPREWQDMEAWDFLERVEYGLRAEAEPRYISDGRNIKESKHYEPDNGWGSVITARLLLIKMAIACAKAPKAKIKVS